MALGLMTCTYKHIQIQYFLGRLSQPVICNQSSVIGYQPEDVIMAATSPVEAAAFGTRKTGISVFRRLKAKNNGDGSVPRGKRLHNK